jgi:hypothetical protein
VRAVRLSPWSWKESIDTILSGNRPTRPSNSYVGVRHRQRLGSGTRAHAAQLAAGRSHSMAPQPKVVLFFPANTGTRLPKVEIVGDGWACLDRAPQQRAVSKSAFRCCAFSHLMWAQGLAGRSFCLGRSLTAVQLHSFLNTTLARLLLMRHLHRLSGLIQTYVPAPLPVEFSTCFSALLAPFAPPDSWQNRTLTVRRPIITLLSRATTANSFVMELLLAL